MRHVAKKNISLMFEMSCALMNSSMWFDTCMLYNGPSEVHCTYDFQQYDILLSVESDEPVQPLFKPKNDLGSVA